MKTTKPAHQLSNLLNWIAFFLVGIAMLLLLAACQQADEPSTILPEATLSSSASDTTTPPTQQVTTPQPTLTSTPRPTQLPHPEAMPTNTATEPPIVEILDAETALSILFGRSGQIEDFNGESMYIWQDREGALFTGETIYSRVLLFTEYQEAAQEKALLIAASAPAGYDCHACAPFIGGAVFVKTELGWQISSTRLDIASIGSFGAAPDGQLAQIGPERFGAVFESIYSGQGYFTTTFYLIAELNGQLRVTFTRVIQQGNGGTCGTGLDACWDWQSQVEFVPGNQPDIFSIRITSNGTRLENSQVVPFTEVNTYVFDGTTYQVELPTPTPANGLSLRDCFSCRAIR